MISKILGFVSEWSYRILISPLLLIMWFSHAKDIQTGDYVKWKGHTYRAKLVYSYGNQLVADLDQVEPTIVPLYFTGIPTSKMRKVRKPRE